jgi:hypothetical protein
VAFPASSTAVLVILKKPLFGSSASTVILVSLPNPCSGSRRSPPRWISPNVDFGDLQLYICNRNRSSGNRFDDHRLASRRRETGRDHELQNWFDFVMGGEQANALVAVRASGLTFVTGIIEPNGESGTVPRLMARL